MSELEFPIYLKKHGGLICFQRKMASSTKGVIVGMLLTIEGRVGGESRSFRVLAYYTAIYVVEKKEKTGGGRGRNPTGQK